MKRVVLKRETFGNFGPLHHVVRALFVKPVPAIKDELKIFVKLIILGADVNAKSVTGDSPLHMVAMFSINETCTMAMLPWFVNCTSLP